MHFTSHADGSIKFWDASGCNLSFLYKLRTNRLFDRVQTANSSASIVNRDGTGNIRTVRKNSNSTDEQLQQQINSITISNESNALENPFAIYSIKICCDGKYLIAAARGGHVTLFKFTGSELDKADEGLGDLSSLEVPILHRNLANDHESMMASGHLSNVNDASSRQNAERKVRVNIDNNVEHKRNQTISLFE
jgi:hypothetical protein